MKLIEYFSFLENKDYKIKVTFILIILVSILIVITDAISIFTLLPIISATAETSNLESNFIYSNYLPSWFSDFIIKLSYQQLLYSLLVIFIFRNFLHLFNNYIIYRFSKFLEVDTSKKLFFLLVKKKYINFFNQTSSEIIKDFRDSVGGYVYFIECVARTISNFLILLIFSILLFYLSFNETLVIFIYFICIFFIFKKIVSKLSIKYGRKANLSSNNINLVILNTYKNFSQIILRKLKKNYLNYYLNFAIEYSYSRLIISFIKSNTKQVLEIAVLCFIIFIFYFFNLIYGKNDLLILIVIFMTAAYRMLPLVNNLVESLINLKNLQFPYKIIETRIKYFNKKYKTIKFLSDKKIKNNFSKNIRLRNISFKYKKENEFLFRKANFEIKKNEIIGIIGGSGKGKTTFIKILLGLLEPNIGQILVDNKKIIKNKINNYQNLFAYLPQENLFMPGSIKENIAFGDDKIDNLRVINSLKDTNCLKFVNKLKKKIEHPILEDGKNFSIGQLQRFALARAIYFNNEILILDEPTSALDSSSEKKFIELIYKLKKKKTIIIISHKKNTLKNCNKIFEIKNKKFLTRKFKSL